MAAVSGVARMLLANRFPGNSSALQQREKWLVRLTQDKLLISTHPPSNAHESHFRNRMRLRGNGVASWAFCKSMEKAENEGRYLGKSQVRLKHSSPDICPNAPGVEVCDSFQG